MLLRNTLCLISTLVLPLTAQISDESLNLSASIAFLSQDENCKFNKPGLLEKQCGNLQQLLLKDQEDELLKKFSALHFQLTALSPTIPKLLADQLCNFWIELIEAQKNEDAAFLKPLSADSYNLKDNPYLTATQAREMAPYLLPIDHPAKPFLDEIFNRSRALQDADHFEEAGFITWKIQPRSFIRVALHPSLEGYLLKVYLDNELRLKKHFPGWFWFVKRCEGARLIAAVIKKKQIQHFIVAKKWIYVLPLTHLPPESAEYMIKTEVLVAEKMNIVSDNKSRHAWQTLITKEHLDELYMIIARANGRSYRPDNIPYTKEGVFAFIDTEYPFNHPDFKGVSHYLNPEMRAYWESLIENGGP